MKYKVGDLVSVGYPSITNRTISRILSVNPEKDYPYSTVPGVRHKEYVIRLASPLDVILHYKKEEQ